MTINELASELERSLGLCAESVPAGFRTMEAWAKIWKANRTTAWGLCKKHVREGRMIQKKFRVHTELQRNRLVTHYKAVK